MKFRSIILYLGLMISTGSLAAGYFLSGYWQILPVLFVMLIFGILTKKRFWSASGLLLVHIVLAAIGVIAGLPAGLMILTCIAALVSWDLAQFEQSLVGNSHLETSISLEIQHMHALALTALTGLLLALMSAYIDLQLPFGVIVSLVLIAMGGLVYSMQYIVKKKR